MAKKALRKDLYREIKNTRARFLSIFLLVALAVAFLSGLRTTQPDMTKSADVYLDECNLMDVRLLSTLGLTEEDLAAVSALDGVSAAQEDWEVDALVASDDAILVVKTISLPENGLNQPYLTEGRMPEASDECIVEARLLESLGKEIGDTLTFDTGTGTYEDALSQDTYTVVGTCTSPLYISVQRGTSSLGSGSISAIVYLPREAYTLDYYTDIYLTLDGAKELNAYSQEYKDLVADFADSIEDFANQRADLRTEEIRLEAQDTLDEAQQEYNDAKAEADEKLADAEQELADARTQLDDGWTEYYDGLETLEAETADGQQQIADAQTELEDAYGTLVSGEADYQDGKKQLEDAQAQYNSGLEAYNSGLAQYEAGYAQYQAGLEEYQSSLAQYEAGYAQYQAGLAEYNAGLAQWQAAWEQLEAAGLTESETGLALQAQKVQLDASKTTLDETASQLASSKAQLDTAKATLDETSTQLEASKAQLDAAKATLDQAAAAISSSQAQLKAARSQLSSGWAEYYDGQDQLTEAQAELDSAVSEAQQELEDALAELNDGEADYADGLTEYEDAKAEADEKLADAQQQIDDGQEEIDSIEDCTWYVLDRSTNLGFASYENDAENMGNLATMFPLIFFLVAALVCLTTMTRMVEEQRVTIGGLKALGYSKADIATKYVGYGLIASVGGSILGLVVGCTLIPWIIITCWQIMYSIPRVCFTLCPRIYLFSAGTAVVVIVGTVLSATLSALRATPATLMRPKAPKAGKRVLLERIKPLWNRLRFTQKVTVRNLFRYKKRFWMTIIGIGGCTALIVTGFGLRDSINDILDIQYDQLSLYNATAVVEEEKIPELEALLEENELVNDYALVHQNSIDFEGTSTISGYYMVLDDPDALDGFLVFRHRLTREPVELTDDGIYICEKLSELLDLKVGDTLVLSGDERVTATIAGIVENRVYNYVYMTQSYYESLYGEMPAYNQVMLMYTEDSTATEEAVGKALLDAGVISSITQVSSIRSALDDSFHTINYAVLVIIISAAALAFVVLFNLSSINITERKRELATLKVLGFHNREVSAYVLRENVFLTVLGTLLGLIMGKGLHAFLVKTVEVEMVMFGRSAHPVSYVLALVLTILFSAVVNLIAGHTLRKIDMVESLKSVE